MGRSSLGGLPFDSSDPDPGRPRRESDDLSGVSIASRGFRLSARVVDLVVFTWLTAFVLIEIDQRLLGGDPLGRRAGRIELTSARSVVLVVLAVVVFEVIPVWVAGATIGKAVFGLRVVRRSGGQPALIESLGRAGVFYAFLALPAQWPVLAFGVIVLLVASVVVPPTGRGLHDRVAGTIVVQLPR